MYNRFLCQLMYSGDLLRGKVVSIETKWGIRIYKDIPL